ncbi:MAG: hypothetical protein AAFW66_15825 [Pseudomonadota bacterium]
MTEKDSDLLGKAKRIHRVADLPYDRSPAEYLVTAENSETKTVSLQKRKRQVLDLLMQAPLYAASPVRLSDMVHLLKLEDGIDIETVMFPGDPGTGTTRYGIYVLRSMVERLSEHREAA